MSERSPSTDGIERRTVLSALAVGVGGVGLSRHAFAREEDDATYVVQQGDRCVPITPLSGDETVEEFYDYRTPNTDPSGPAYSSYGTTDLQRPETSICFLYDGPEGLSLVLVHDALNDGTNGGSVTFRLDGLTGGEWLVGDDIYDGESNYDRFRETDDGWTVDWTWTEGRSDGGVYGHLGRDFAVTVHPAFNEDAALYGDPYEGEIIEWQFLSGDRSDPDRISLSLSDPLTIRAGGCGGSETTTRETTEERQETTEEETEENEEDDRPSEPLRPEVEVVPGRVNPKSHGRLPVVVRSSAEFDATAIEPGSVELEPGRAPPAKAVRTDSTGDGRADLKLHFWMDATGIDWDTDELTLSGRTRDGLRVVGTADVRLAGRGDDDDEDERDDDQDDDDRDDDDEEEWDEEEDDDRDEDREDEDEDGDDEEDDDDDEEDGDERANGRGRNDEDGRGNGRGNGKKKGKSRGNEKGRGNGRGNGEKRGKGRGNGKKRGHGKGDD